MARVPIVAVFLLTISSCGPVGRDCTLRGCENSITLQFQDAAGPISDALGSVDVNGAITVFACPGQAASRVTCVQNGVVLTSFIQDKPPAAVTVIVTSRGAELHSVGTSRSIARPSTRTELNATVRRTAA